MTLRLLTRSLRIICFILDVGKQEIRSTPGIVKAFLGVLTSTEASVQKIVLRTLGFLAIRN
eukprot:Awhi_evm1s9035